MNPCEILQLPETKSRKSHKKEKKNKHESESEKSCLKCCIPRDNILDCCTPAYQRLDRLRSGWANIATVGLPDLGLAYTVNNSEIVFTWAFPNLGGLINRSGDQIIVPITGTFVSTGTTPTSTYNIVNANLGGVLIQVINNLITLPENSSTTFVPLTGTVTYLSELFPDIQPIILQNALYAYLFVNSLRYLYFESCGRNDQVTGWIVDTQDGNLQVFTDLPDLGITTSDSRNNLITTSASSITAIDIKKLKILNDFYSLSLRAINEVKQNPRGEGNIVEVTDKCDVRWLVAVNTASSNSEPCSNNTQYVIVVTKLC